MMKKTELLYGFFLLGALTLLGLGYHYLSGVGYADHGGLYYLPSDWRLIGYAAFALLLLSIGYLCFRELATRFSSKGEVAK